MELSANDKLRKSIEHNFLPTLFYEQREAVLSSILDKQERFFSDIYLVYSVDVNTYREEDFRVETKSCIHNNQTIYFVVVTMPSAEFCGQCRRVYFVYEEKQNLARYFTVEKGESGDFSICSYDNELKRYVHGKAPLGSETEFQVVGNVFLKYLDPELCSK